jgi:hypothetical protein
VAWGRDQEVIIDPLVLTLVWNDFAPRELRLIRHEEDEQAPTDLEEELYADETGREVFGEDCHRYPLDFVKSTLLFTNRIRTLFSGRKFTSFRDMLHDSVLPKHHKELKHVRPLFDDPEYESFRRGDDLRDRPWDVALRGSNPADFEMGSQTHAFSMSTVGTLGQGVKRIVRFLNEDDFSTDLIDEVNVMSWPDAEPLDVSVGYHQFVVDYLALYQHSFGLPFFSVNDVSPWIVARTRTKDGIDPTRKIDHAITVTMPNFAKLTLNDVMELRKERFVKCYREIVESGGLETLERTDVDEMIKREMLAATKESAFGIKELTIDLAKLVLMFLPGSGLLAEGAKGALEHTDQVLEAGEETGAIRSRFRRFRNRWLWFVMKARSKSGDLFKTLADDLT